MIRIFFFLFLPILFLGAVQLSGSVNSSSLCWDPFPIDDPDKQQYRDWYEFLKLGEKRARLNPSHETRDLFPVGDYYPNIRVVGSGLDVMVPRAFARPGDRWVEIFVQFDESVLAGEPQLNVVLYQPGKTEAVGRRGIIPETRVGMLKVDLRQDDLSQARVELVLEVEGKRRAVAEVSLFAQPPKQALAAGHRILVDLDIPDGISPTEAAPVTFGVPFPAGALWDTERLGLVNEAGEVVPFQLEVAGRWAEDGAIKWVRFDAVAIPEAGLYVEVMEPGTPREAAFKSLSVEEVNGRIIVDTGVARYELAPGASPIRSIWMGDQQVVRNSKGLYVIDQNDRLALAASDGQTMELESAGPVSSSVRFEGDYRTVEGEPLARHITRVELFAGQPEAKVTHTLVLSRDTNEVWFKEAGWEFEVASGAPARGAFGVAHADAAEFVELQFTDENTTAFIFQESHLRFAKGDNRFHSAVLHSDGRQELLHEGERMGDWAALTGPKVGFMVSIRDAALQHPKEFELGPGRLTARLFSHRGGEELDFRAETLVDKWNLPETFTHQGKEIIVRDTVAAYESNAIGWAKTHDMVISPLVADNGVAQAIDLASRNAARIYAHVDPWWIYETKALGPLYPRDTKNYPGAEATIDQLVDLFSGHLRGLSFYGFVDYNAGPTFHPRGSRGDLVMERRFVATYQLRPDLWALYARSGERTVREFAEHTNRTFSDNYMAHWDGPGKRRGLILEARMGSGGEPFLGTGDLPFYWMEDTAFSFRYHADCMSLYQLTHDYFLTGNRRANEIVRQYAETVKEDWTPRVATRHFRKVMTFRGLLHAYELTLDPELRAMTEATLSYVYDPEGVTGLTKNKYLGATYKARVAVRALIEGWDMFGTPPYYDMASRLAEHKWYRYVPLGGTTSPYGIVGNFLYHQTGSPIYALWLDFALKYAPQRAVSSGPFRAADITSGIYMSQDVVAHLTDEDKARMVWLAYRDSDAAKPLAVAVKKGAYDTVDVSFTTRSPRPADTGLWVQPLDVPVFWNSRDRSLISMQSSSNLGPNPHGHVTMRVNVPKEAPGESYATNPLHHGDQYVAAIITRPELLHQEPAGRRGVQEYTWEGHISAVLSAPQGWQTTRAPDHTRVYFNVPEESRGAGIFFSTPTALFTPLGTPFNAGEEAGGWVELPANQPGLWSFELGADSKWVEVRNLPPFFAFGDPVHYFTPPIPWVEWITPRAGEAHRDSVAVDFKIHLAGEGEIKGVKVYLDEELIYEGKTVPEDLRIESREEDVRNLRVEAESGEYRTKSVLLLGPASAN